MRSLAVVLFVAAVAGAAGYASQRPTVARGEVLAADLMAANKGALKSLDCDPEIPVGIDGAVFACTAVFPYGGTKRLEFELDRAGAIRQRRELDPAPAPRIDSSDPWR